MKKFDLKKESIGLFVMGLLSISIYADCSKLEYIKFIDNGFTKSDIEKICNEDNKQSKWISPSGKSCKYYGGVLDNNGCKADWTTAKKICLASEGRLPSRDDLKKVVSTCGGTNISFGDKNWTGITVKNYANKPYQECYKAKGFASFHCWSSTTYAGVSDSAWGVDFYRGNQYYGNKILSGYVRCVRAGQ